MLRRYQQIRTQIHQLMDACLFAVAFYLAYTVRETPLFAHWMHLVNYVGSVEDYLWLYVVVIPTAPLLLEYYGFYNFTMRGSRFKMLKALTSGCVWTTLGIILVVYLFKLTLPRPIIVLFGVFSFILVWGKEEVLRAVSRSGVSRAQSARRMLIVGTLDEINKMKKEMGAHPEDFVEIVGEVHIGGHCVDKVVQLLHEHAVNGVIICARHSYFEQVESVIKACEMEGVETWLVADFFSTQVFRTSVDVLHKKPVLVFRSAPEISWQAILKHVLDFVVALILVTLLMPLFVVVALLTWIFSPGPVLFRQKRCGLNGQPFTMFKFRTMIMDAEGKMKELSAHNEMSGPVFKMTNDPRITPIGRFLRKFSIDELPQLFNVLRGEMSLVGPRPLPVYEVEKFYNTAHRRRLSVRPGLTCLWQIGGRNKVNNFDDWVRLDLEYIDNWSLWLDFKILLKTIPAVFVGTGAK